MPDIAALAAIHAAAFTMPRPWTAAEIATLLEQRGTFLCRHPQGFALGRVLLDEAELLSMAVAPRAWRQGIGQALLADFSTSAQAKGARQAFLEVAITNIAARTLYSRAGWQECGQRPGYYRDASGQPVAAILMRRDLSAGATDHAPVQLPSGILRDSL